jgi:hypothetical protein
MCISVPSKPSEILISMQGHSAKLFSGTCICDHTHTHTHTHTHSHTQTHIYIYIYISTVAGKRLGPPLFHYPGENNNK